MRAFRGITAFLAGTILTPIAAIIISIEAFFYKSKNDEKTTL
jgi:hypothetical protein